MHRVDSPSAIVSPDGKAAFTSGDPIRGISATGVPDRWLNSVQEEIANVIEYYGLALDKNNDRQLLSILRGLPGPNWALNWDKIDTDALSEMWYMMVGIAYRREHHALSVLTMTGEIIHSFNLSTFTDVDTVFNLWAFGLIEANGILVAIGADTGGRRVAISYQPYSWITVANPFGSYSNAIMPLRCKWGDDRCVITGATEGLGSANQSLVTTITNLHAPNPVVGIYNPVGEFGVPTIIAHNGKKSGAGSIWLVGGIPDALMGSSPGALYRSENAINWTRVNWPGAPTVLFHRIDYLTYQGVFWATERDARRYWISTNGINWTSVEPSGGDNQPIIAVASYPGGIALVDANGYLGAAVSPYDQPVWTDLPLLGAFSSSEIESFIVIEQSLIIYAAGVICGMHNGRVVVARDPIGEGWRVAGIPTDESRILDYAAGRFWASGVAMHPELYASHFGW